MTSSPHTEEYRRLLKTQKKTIEKLLLMERKAAAFDFLFAHPDWLTNRPALRFLTTEKALEAIEEAIEKETL